MMDEQPSSRVVSKVETLYRVARIYYASELEKEFKHALVYMTNFMVSMYIYEVIA